MNKPIKIRLHVLSPIHIGCDDVYEPTSFVIDAERKKLIEFDPMEFVKRLKPQEMSEFSKTASGDNLLAIFKMIKRFYKPEVNGREVEITDFLVKHYKKILNMGTFDKRAVINQFTINKTAYNLHDNMPYIPGTSLKGALRTAYLSALANVGRIEKFWVICGLLSPQDIANPESAYKQIGKKGVAKKLEEKLLKGSFDTDPFRMVKVSDLLTVVNVSTKVVYAVNKKKKKSDKESLADKGGVYQIFETIHAGSIFEGVINIATPEKTSGMLNPINLQNLLLSTHKFYDGNLKQEITLLNEALNVEHKAGMAANAQFKDRFKQDAFLIRMGRHSGAEAVTIEGNRNIKIMQGKDKQPEYRDHATTLWLASDEPKPTNNNSLLPFGWAMLEVLPFDGVTNLYPERKKTIKPAGMTDAVTGQTINPQEADAKRRAEEERRSAEEARLQQIEDEKKRNDEEESRARAEWAALTDEERLVRTPTLPNVAEQQVVECFNKLDLLAAPFKEELAKAIKEYYIRSGKWEGGSKKQIEKVKKLKKILNE